MNFGAKIQIRWFARELVSNFNFWTKTGLDLKNPDHPTVELKLTHVHWSLWLCHYSKDNQIHKWLKLELRQMECVPLTSEKGKNAVKVWNSRMRRNMFSTTAATLLMSIRKQSNTTHNDLEIINSSDSILGIEKIFKGNLLSVSTL